MRIRTSRETRKRKGLTETMSFISSSRQGADRSAAGGFVSKKKASRKSMHTPIAVVPHLRVEVRTAIASLLVMDKGKH